VKVRKEMRSNRSEGDSLEGFIFAISAYVIWGFLPIYMKAMSHISPIEIVAHRIIWSVPIAGFVLIMLGRFKELASVIRNPRLVLMSFVTATLISINWGIYVWAMTSGHALDAALGYFVNPLFSIFLGAVLLKEHLNRAQLIAILIVVCAVSFLSWETGNLPWIPLGITLSWGTYAFLKKSLPMGPNQGFFLEVLLLSPIAFYYVITLEKKGFGHFYDTSYVNPLLLIGTGLATALPMMLYVNGAKLLRLSTIGILQYLVPTMIFIIAIFIFKENFGTSKLIVFSMIWFALIIYSFGVKISRE